MKLRIIKFLSVFILSSCSSVGLKYADNGLLYYFPQNCNKYRYSESHPYELQCIHKGNVTGIFVYPVSAERMLEYKNKVRSETNYSESSNESSIKEVVSCRKIGDLLGQVYQFANRCPIGYRP